eukprot:TRINITY_DN1127_c0_g1_i2.p1 TRINITY_DN1127_c0_g1~~TRINITY_DN1127_c0_g1_i2.p1  ORF type:complete len:323 (-),score=65.36 TRINITY_DN1127_c0_g1_i2:105-950(-)
MSCPDCGREHTDQEDYSDSSSSSDEEDYHVSYPFFGFDSDSEDDDSSEDEGPMDFLSRLLPPPPFFSMAGMHLLEQFHAFQNRQMREERRVKKEEETNRKRQLGSIYRTPFSSKLELNESQCVICLDDFEEGNELKKLLCNHHYHATCIDQWLVTNGRCPLCNSKAVNTLEETQNKLYEAKRLTDDAKRRIRRRPQMESVKKRRIEGIKTNPANKNGKKLVRSAPSERSRSLFPRSIPPFPFLPPPFMFPPIFPPFPFDLNFSDEDDDESSSEEEEPTRIL